MVYPVTFGIISFQESQATEVHLLRVLPKVEVGCGIEKLGDRNLAGQRLE